MWRLFFFFFFFLKDRCSFQIIWSFGGFRVLKDWKVHLLRETIGLDLWRIYEMYIELFSEESRRIPEKQSPNVLRQRNPVRFL